MQGALVKGIEGVRKEGNSLKCKQIGGMKKTGSYFMSKGTIRVLRRVVSILMFAVIIFAGYSLCSKACAATETGTVNDRAGVYMRVAPSKSAEIIMGIAYNEKVEITGEAMGDGLKWYKVKYSGKTGYAAAAYITKNSTGGGSGGSSGGTSDFTNTYGVVNTTDGLNVRSGAGAGYTYLGTLNYKAQVKVNGVKKDHNGEDWYEIIYVGKTGFVKAEFMDLIEVPPYVPNENFEQSLTEQGFPESYKVLLRQIHAQYPNWQFVAGKTGFDWDYAVNREFDLRANTIHESFPDAWKSHEPGDYDPVTGKYKYYDSGGYVAASKGIVAYYMDPRNFLNSTDVFQFISTKYNSSLHTASGLQAMLNGSFMGGAFPEPSHRTYNDVIMEAARKSGVSPYTLATMILQEQGYNGRGGSISGREPGFEGLYNFFNIRAYASGNYTAVQYGLLYARDRGWTTRSKSIIEGAQWFSANYVNSGQYTQYLKKFNVMNGAGNVGYGQYMTNVSGAYQEGSALKAAYSASLNTGLVFEIPVFNNMSPEAAPKPSTNPEKPDKPDKPIPQKSGWNLDSNGWKYLYPDGHYAVNGIHTINNIKYAFGSDGYIVQGWYQDINGKYYYSTNNGLKTGLISVAGHKYYLDPNTGIMLTGWQKLSGYWYYFNASGHMLTGWQRINGKDYYIYDDGHTAINEITSDGYLVNKHGAKAINMWVISNSKWYYGQDDGRPVKNQWKWINGQCYYFYEDGHAAMNERTPDGFYVNANGAWVQDRWIKNRAGWWYSYAEGGYPRNEFKEIGGQIYCFNSNGYMLTGWQKLSGYWYYFNASGHMLTGWQRINGKDYYIYDDGHTAINEITSDGYLVNKHGAKAINMWVISNSKWYYGQDDGRPVKNQWKWINGQCYYFYEDGHAAMNERTPDGFYVNGNGAWIR